MRNQSSATRIEVVHNRDGAIENTERPRLADWVYEEIKEAIFEFRMTPGERFAEQELATRFGVSRTPLRFALHVLAKENFLMRVEGHACWQVKPIDLNYFDDLYDFRTEIEAIAIRRLCRTAPMPDLSRLTEFWCCPIDQRESDGREIARQDEHLHSTLVELAGNSEMLRTHRNLTELIRIIRRLDFVDPVRIEAAFDEHIQLLSAVISRRADQAELLIRAHIDASRAEIRQITLHKLMQAQQLTAPAPKKAPVWQES
ncbi:MAG: GntR family transcriptional regulator [Burkholderiaceae bacterium]